jgi:uncharacterized protein
MIRAVLDANVLVSALVSPGGIPAQVLRAWRDERFHLVASQAILSEIDQVLRYAKVRKRHGMSDNEIKEWIDDLAHLAVLVPGQITVTVIIEDPADDRYLECALEGEAECIVSGDQHLLRLNRYEHIDVLTPRAFLDVVLRKNYPGSINA